MEDKNRNNQLNSNEVVLNVDLPQVGEGKVTWIKSNTIFYEEDTRQDLCTGYSLAVILFPVEVLQ